MDISEILKLLPHRYPMIMIDRVIEIISGEKIIALKNVTMNEPYFTGHFPNNPVMPGVLIVESMGQAGGILAMSGIETDRIPDSVYFMGFDNVRFRKPVIPGDQLILEVKMIRKRSRAFKMKAFASVNEKLVAEAEFMAAYGEPL